MAYNARGWGKSDKTLAGYKLADLADEALSLVKALGIRQYVLVGHSMGGKVAQLAASRRPEGLSGLILVAPAQLNASPNPEEMTYRNSAGFHADTPMKFFAARHQLRKEWPKVQSALDEFKKLFDFFLKRQREASWAQNSRRLLICCWTNC